MRIEETFQLQAPREVVFDFLSNGERVAGCVPGVEGFTERANGTYEANLKAQLGPIKAMFKGEMSLETSPPDRLQATGRGLDRSSGSRAEVTFTGELIEMDGGSVTRVDTAADVTIRGRLGQFGTGVIRATATELIREFVACANAQLAHQPPTAEADEGSHAAAGTEEAETFPRGTASPPPPSGTRGQTSQFRLMLRIAARLLRDTWRRVIRVIRGWAGR